MSKRKIPREDVPRILEKLKQGQTQAAVAAEYGVSQRTISVLRKKEALAISNQMIGELNGHPRMSIGLRAFVNKAWQAREDALSIGLTKGKTDTEWEVALDAAEGAATAWRKVANELANRRGQ